jgi:hypothetical protein
MTLDWEKKILIDIALNMGILMARDKIPMYADNDYYEELIDMANEFILKPVSDELYVVQIDKFAEETLLKRFGGV